jgi:hypothetical protein
LFHVEYGKKPEAVFWRKGITVVTHGEGGFAKVMVIGTLKNTISTITKRTL